MMLLYNIGEYICLKLSYRIIIIYNRLHQMDYL